MSQPDDPEEQFLGELGERLAVVEGLVGAVRDGRRPDAARLDALAGRLRPAPTR